MAIAEIFQCAAEGVVFELCWQWIVVQQQVDDGA